MCLRCSTPAANVPSIKFHSEPVSISAGNCLSAGVVALPLFITISSDGPSRTRSSRPVEPHSTVANATGSFWVTESGLRKWRYVLVPSPQLFGSKLGHLQNLEALPYPQSRNHRMHQRAVRHGRQQTCHCTVVPNRFVSRRMREYLLVWACATPLRKNL